MKSSLWSNALVCFQDSDKYSNNDYVGVEKCQFGVEPETSVIPDDPK